MTEGEKNQTLKLHELRIAQLEELVDEQRKELKKIREIMRSPIRRGVYTAQATKEDAHEASGI